jgi:RNA polymerase sigma-70 factor, ECF subfamily
MPGLASIGLPDALDKREKGDRSVAYITNSAKLGLPSRISILPPKRSGRHFKKTHRFTENPVNPPACNITPQSESPDWAALEEIVSRSRSQFISVAYRILRNREDAEDAVQNALLSAYTHLPSFEGRSALKTWFTRIVLNASLMLLRKRKSAHIGLHPEFTDVDTRWMDEIPSGESDPEGTYAKTEKYEIIDTLLHELSPMLRKAFTMTYLGGIGSKQAGALLGIPTGTVKARLFRAKQYVKRRAQRIIAAPGHRLLPTKYRPKIAPRLSPRPIEA